jgi:energy-converting hydrogenase Eha subunit B
MRVVSVFRIALGVVATLVACWCFVVIVGAWFLFPDWPGRTAAQDLEFRVAMTLGCIAVGAICGWLAEWCFFRQGPNQRN